MSTGDIVMLKKVSLAHHPYEIGIHQYFSAEPIASHPRNHCVPLLNVLEVPGEPDTVLLVMPLLRSFDDPKFQTIGELVECLRQIFEVSTTIFRITPNVDSIHRAFNSCIMPM